MGPTLYKGSALQDQKPRTPTGSCWECDVCLSLGGPGQPQEPHGQPLCAYCERDNAELEAKHDRHILDDLEQDWVAYSRAGVA